MLWPRQAAAGRRPALVDLRGADPGSIQHADRAADQPAARLRGSWSATAPRGAEPSVRARGHHRQRRAAGPPRGYCQAFHAPSGADAAIGLALDGGYWLIGLSIRPGDGPHRSRRRTAATARECRRRREPRPGKSRRREVPLIGDRGRAAPRLVAYHPLRRCSASRSNPGRHAAWLARYGRGVRNGSANIAAAPSASSRRISGSPMVTASARCSGWNVP